MNDYRTKRRFRQQKLTKQGFYERRQQQSRLRRRAQQATVGVLSFEQIFAPENLIGIYDKLEHNAGNAPGPDQITYKMLGRREICQIMRQLSVNILNDTYEPSGRIAAGYACGGFGYLLTGRSGGWPGFPGHDFCGASRRRK